MEVLAARDLFPIVSRCIFMNHASVSPVSERVRAAVERTLEQMTAQPSPDGWAWTEGERVRQVAARLIGGQPDEIAFTRSTGHGISLLARGLDWRAGDNVVGVQGDFPTNVYPWMALGPRGVELRLVEPSGGRVTPEVIFERVDDRTRVVALSHVQFISGYRADLHAIGQECRRRGILLSIDAMQSLGAIQVDVGRTPIDFLAVGGNKWLLAPLGMGFCWGRRDLLDRLEPPIVGAGSVERERSFYEYALDYAGGGRRFEESAVSPLDLAALEAAIGLLLDVGTEAVEARVLEIATGLAAGLAERGFVLHEPWPRRREEMSGIVSFKRRDGDAAGDLRALRAAGVIGRVHRDYVRLSPHFYNTDEEVARVLEVLAPQAVER
jgi:selenocysteine lyase/cysteine desulfurase